MAYATLEQLIETFGQAEVAQLLCDESADVTEALLRDALASGDLSAYSNQQVESVTAAIARAEKILERQSEFIESKISSRYTLPLQNEHESIVECCLHLARAALADDGANISKHVLNERDHWRGWLKDVQKGMAFLPGEPTQNSQGTRNGYLTRTRPSKVNWGNY